MLHVVHPPGCPAERRYILDVMLGGFLGLAYRATPAPVQDVAITLAGANPGRQLVLADVLLQTPPDRWLTPASLPDRPLPVWDLAGAPVAAPAVSPRLPVIYGRPLPGGGWLAATEREVRLGVDLLGGAFFMLSRYEELVTAERDAHGRFPAAAALALREGFLDRPIVNEYLEVLWWALHRLWPGLRRRERAFRVCPSHDVDAPWCTAGLPLRRVLANVAGDLLRRRDILLAARRLRSLALGALGRRDADMCQTFDFLMDVSERQGLRSAFYFIAGRTDPRLDGEYSLADPGIRKLLRRIHRRGHEIGLHPSYHTYRSPERLRAEFAALRRAVAAEGITQPAWGGRQHYLRWAAPDTWQGWADAGLDYDATVGFADRPGFRAGTCYEYPVFNLRTRRCLPLVERPLTAMDGTLLDPRYLGLRQEQAWERLHTLRERCRLFQGDFSLLWHNSSLVSPAARALYRRALGDA